MLHIKSGRGSLFSPFARLSRTATPKDQAPLTIRYLTSASNAGLRRYASNASTSTKATPSTSPKSSSGWKITGGITVLCGGGLVAGGVLYKYNADVRSYLDKNVPVIGTFLHSMGLLSDSNNKETEVQKRNDLAGSKKLPSDSGPLNLGFTTPRDTAQPLNPITGEKKKSRQEPVASLSSMDQTAISAVDLAIAKTVEKEARQVLKTEVPQGVKPDTSKEGTGKQPKTGGGKMDSATAAVSAVDFTGVSSIDLDIAASVERVAEPVKPKAAPEPPSELIQEISKTPVAADTSLTDKEVEAIVDQSAMEAMVHQSMEHLRSLAQEAVKAQQTAAEVIKSHVEQLKTALAHSQEQRNLKDVSDMVLSSQKATTDSIDSAKAAQVKVNEEVEKLHSIIKEAEAAGAKEAGTLAVEEAAQLSYIVLKAALDMQHSKAEVAVLEEHQKHLQESKDMFRKELQEMMPGSLDKENVEDSQEKDVRSESVLLAFARKRLDQLGQELSGYQAEEQKRLEQTLKVQRDEDAKLAELKLEQEAQRMASEFETQLKKKEVDWEAEQEVNVRQQLRRQAAAYSDHLAEVLRVQAAELDSRHKEDLEQKLNAEKDVFETQLNGALARLQGVESVMENRAEVEKTYQQSQKLWAACQSLSTAIDKGAADQPRPLLSQLTAIHEAAAEDPVVSNVLKSLPEEAVTRGVLNEEGLRRRFYKVRRWCRRVAMIGENGSSPWTHLLSYFQSFLIFDSFDPNKEGEMIDVENLDTFDLLARAEYYLRSGDLELATRLVNQLRGEPRSVARDWLLEARLLLETRQAANLLTAYAAVLGAVGSD